MTTNNKHMNIWRNDSKGYCVPSYALTNEGVGFISCRPNSTEVEYVARNIGEW
jgi:hypothetical protein